MRARVGDRTFSLLNILFSLQLASGKGKPPLLTLPIGR